MKKLPSKKGRGSVAKRTAAKKPLPLVGPITYYRAGENGLSKDAHRRIMVAEMRVARGDFSQGAAFYEKMPKDDRAFLVTAFVAVVAAVGGGDGVLFDEVLKDVAGYPKRYGTPEAKLATEIFYVWLRQFLRVESDHPAWFEKLDLGAVPHEWRPQVGYLAVKRLERLREFAAADVLANALLNLVPSKAMLGSAADIHLKLALAQIARERGRMDEAMRWCRETVVSSKARDIALPFLGKMMGPKSALEIAFVELAPDLLKRIKKGTNDYFRNLVRFHNRFSGESVSEELKPREFYLACSLKRGLRYKEIAERLGVSTNRVHAMAKDVYTTLGVRGASAIGKRVW